MKVILKDDVKSLGKMGDIVNVASGYARNFLIPKGLAVPADTKNVRAMEHEKRVIQEKARKLRQAAQTLAEKISKLNITIKAKAGEEEKLFGSVTTMDIEEALKAEGIEIDRKKIHLDEPIKRLGAYTVSIKLAQDITATLNVQVVPE
jgi:large subunit ribosomal protein L9